jgi:hypothetical protein
MEEKSNALSPLHPRILNVDTADGGNYLSTQLNVSTVTRGELPGSPLTEDTDPAARDLERLLDDELEIRVSHSHILPCHHAARTHMPHFERVRQEPSYLAATPCGAQLWMFPPATPPWAAA